MELLAFSSPLDRAACTTTATTWITNSRRGIGENTTNTIAILPSFLNVYEVSLFYSCIPALDDTNEGFIVICEMCWSHAGLGVKTATCVVYFIVHWLNYTTVT